jgi:hypothetical protein
MLETSGRKDHRAGEGLSARTTRYVHTIIHGVLGQAVRDGLLLRNPADGAMVTLTIYAHVMPVNQRETANTFARLVREARGA